MKKAVFKIVYNRNNRFDKNGKAPVYIECYLNRKRKYLKTGIKIEPKHWDSKQNTIKSNYPNFIQLNRRLKKQIKLLEDFEYKHIEEDKNFSLNLIDDSVFNKEIDLVSGNFIEFCKKTIKENVSKSNRTIRQHKVTIKRLEKYFPDLTFNKIDFSIVKEFDDILRREGLHVNTIATHHKVFKVYLNLAIKMNLLPSENYPYKNFKVKTIQTKRTFLTMAEVDKVEKLKFTDNTRHIEQVRDMFLFGCYTGMRYSDVMELTNEDIKEDKDGYFVETRMNKTQNFIKIPLALLFKGKAVNIVDKYKSDIKRKFLFPRQTPKGMTNQNTNRILKVIMMLAKIDKNITFHLSRHTFGTNLAVATSDQFLIKELMGHADIKTSMIYIHTSQEQIKNKLKNTDWG
jgi:site-specific recombinase XerD